MISVMLANGLEEIEALTPVDILRRAERDVLTVGIGGKTVRGAHGITVAADLGEAEVRDKHLEALILPGGMPGTLNLEHSDTVQRLVDTAGAGGPVRRKAGADRAGTGSGLFCPAAGSPAFGTPGLCALGAAVYGLHRGLGDAQRRRCSGAQGHQRIAGAGGGYASGA